MKVTITVQCGKSSSRGQYGRCREQTKEAILVWLGTGGFAEEAALGGLCGSRKLDPGRRRGAFTSKEPQMKGPGEGEQEAGEPMRSWGESPLT